MKDAVTKSIRSVADELSPGDASLVALLQLQAESLDRALSDPTLDEATKIGKVNASSKELRATMHELGLSPKARAELYAQTAKAQAALNQGGQAERAPQIGDDRAAMLEALRSPGDAS